MSWAGGSDPGDVGGFTDLVHCKQDGLRWWNFSPMSRFRIFQEVPASAAAVPWGGFDANLMDLLWIFVGLGRGKCFW